MADAVADPIEPALIAAANAVHMSAYYPENPAAWFAHIDSSFATARITRSVTKFHYANAKLPLSLYDTIADIHANVDTLEDPYGDLKVRLCSSFGMSASQRITALLDHPGIGDQKPSVLLDKLWALKPASVDDIVFALFFRRMPSFIRDVVHAKQYESRLELAELCNKIWEERGGAAAAMAATVQSRPPSADRRDRRTRSPARSGQSGGHNKSGARRRQATPAARFPDAAGLCFYHSNFGTKAHKCESPCTYQENGLAGGGL